MDLGLFTQPLLLFGGPYSNLDALLALKKEASRLNISPGHIICTGDIVAYCGQPYETVEAIREWGIHVLMGNCEESFASNADGCGCGFDAGTSCDLLSAEWFQFANERITSDQRQWFSQLPRKITFSFIDKKVQVVHGSATSINQFLFFSSDQKLYEEQINATDSDIIIAGHSGIPFSKSINATLWHNAGAIGMPANDGTNNTWFSVLSNVDKKIKIESTRLTYDYKNALMQMEKAGLKNGYAKALQTGLWPSMDVLTEQEKMRQGKAISIKAIYF